MKKLYSAKNILLSFILISIPVFAVGATKTGSEYDRYIPGCQRDHDIPPFREIEIGDLNHDGTKDKMVACETKCGVHGCPYVIFLSAKGTFVPSGEILSDEPKITDKMANKMPIITSYDSGGCFGEAGTQTFYKFSDGKYREFKKVECDCIKPGRTRPKECP